MPEQEVLFEDDSRGTFIEGPYRYSLWRTWKGHGDRALCGWVMLNPSTANNRDDDPTIRRCMAYAKAWRYAGIVVRNLFALRATRPRDLLTASDTASDPVGPDNDNWLRQWEGMDRIVVAWGTGRYPRLKGRWEGVAALLEPLHPVCLSTARDGQLVHPLYQPAGLVPRPWRVPIRRW
ncbi:DUF1643 domain-containing protein (plasmid) [Nonomuraea sp. NBC_00507]|uniref:DUF1643 domain-containing protein n=1 Tax=Nonomuraea sp. NBC_00507 TaxID=2976002 RepID=UPI002E186F7F